MSPPVVPSSAGRVQIGSSSTSAPAAPAQTAPAKEPQLKPSTSPAVEASRYEAKPQDSGLSVPTKAPAPEERAALNTRTSTLGYGKSSESAPKAAKSPEETAKAVVLGAMTRRQVRVKSEAPGVIHTRIRKGNQDEATPLGRIQNEMQKGAVYDKLTVVGGAHQGDVLGTQEGEKPAHPAALAERAPQGSAVINGGFFVHMEGILDNKGQPLNQTGVPVGPTSTRSDHTPIAEPWAPVYGQVKINDRIGVSAGPMLSQEGKKLGGMEGEQFKYRPGPEGQENHLNNYAGALTHSDENNERSAISVAGDNVVMHTLTTKGQRTKGATMEQWQNITGEVPGATTLNLDGGGSVYSGVRTEDGIKQLSRGGKPTKDIRPVANVITAQPQGLPSTKKSES